MLMTNDKSSNMQEQKKPLWSLQANQLSKQLCDVRNVLIDKHFYIILHLDKSIQFKIISSR